MKFNNVSNSSTKLPEEYKIIFISAETVRHYNLRKRGFFEETTWHSSSQILPLSPQSKGSKSGVRSIGHAFLRRFQNPTIFLKVACDGDLLLPIIVGMLFLL